MSDPQQLRRLSVAALVMILAWGTMTVWMRERWALSVVEIGILGVAAAWAIGWAVHPGKIRISFPLVPLSAAVVWGLATSMAGWTVYRYETLQATLHWGVLFALFWLSLQLFNSSRLRRTFLLAFLYFGLAVSVLAVMEFQTSEGKFLWLFPSGYPELLGPFQNRNNFAAFVELLVPLALWEALRHRRNRTIYLGITALLVAAVVASASRMGALLVAGEVVLVLALASSRGVITRKELTLATACTLAAGIVFIFATGWETLWQRFQEQDPLVFRRDILASTIAMITDRPWYGFGLGTFQTVYPAFATFDIGQIVNHAHNDWLEWAAEGGIPFALLMATMAVWSVRPAFRSVWGIGIIAVFIHALVDFPLARLGVSAWVFALLGVLAAAESDRRAALGDQPLITPIGRSRATLRAKPA